MSIKVIKLSCGPNFRMQLSLKCCQTAVKTANNNCWIAVKKCSTLECQLKSHNWDVYRTSALEVVLKLEELPTAGKTANNSCQIAVTKC